MKKYYGHFFILTLLATGIFFYHSYNGSEADRTPASSYKYTETYFQGPWIPNEDAFIGWKIFNDLDKLLFNSYQVDLSAMGLGTIVVNDNLYKVGTKTKDGKIKDILGVRAIPVKDKVENGSLEMDKHLRKVLYGDENSKDDIFAIIAYNHPEKFKSSPQELQDNLRSEMGITHLGAYIGKGETRNSPVDYHKKIWNVQDASGMGYPAHVYTVSLKGVSQKALNKNLRISLAILNDHGGGPKFPDNYKFDYFRTFNLYEVISFFQGWIDEGYVRSDLNALITDGTVDENTSYNTLLKNKNFFKTYCAEHITIVLNVGMNIIHTERHYKKIWGINKGKKLFAKVNQIWRDVAKEDIPQKFLNDNFKKPLWQRRLKNKKSLRFDIVEKENKKDLKKELSTIGKSLVWKAETTVDLISDFVHYYGDFTKGGIVLPILQIAGFSKETKERMGVPKEQYFAMASKFIKRMMKVDIRLQSYRNDVDRAKGLYISKYNGELSKLVQDPKFKKLKEAQQNEQKNKLRKMIMGMLYKKIDEFKTVYFSKVMGAISQIDPKLAELLKPIVKDVKGVFYSLVTDTAFRRIMEDEKTRKRYLTRETISKMRYPLPEKPNIETIAWVAFMVSVNNKEKMIVDGKTEMMSLMDYSRKLKVKKYFTDQIKDSDVKYVEYYSPPAIVHRVMQGPHKDMAEEDLVIQAVATAYRDVDLEKNTKHDLAFDKANIKALNLVIKKTEEAKATIK